MKVGVVIPTAQGREENLMEVLASLRKQTCPLDNVIVVCDGFQIDRGLPEAFPEVKFYATQWKHEPGMEQPRNVGTRLLRYTSDCSHVWFLDSDVIVAEDALEHILQALETHQDEDAIVVAPYDWLPPGIRKELPELRNDPRWVSFDQYDPTEIRRHDLAAGLACFSGNLVWPINEFVRVGGFWSEIHHGRCEDGELGIRAVAMDVPICFARGARGWHLDHPVNTGLAIERNARDVPMLNDRHPWMEQGAVFMVDRDGKAFDVKCWWCGETVPTIGWWDHADSCGCPLPAIPVST